jgi:thymidylate synthase
MIQNKFEKEEEQYYQLIKDILNNGVLENGRNGNTISIFGSAMRFSLQDNKIPLLTSKHLAWKTCLKELLWFISGSTDNSILQEQNVHIWDGDAKKADKEGDLGTIYGHQWRHFNA